MVKLKVFIEISINLDMLSSAVAKAEKLGKLHNSISEGFGNIAGFLGEETMLGTFREAASCNTYNHDLKINGFTFDVKSLKTGGIPNNNYQVVLSNNNINQDTQYYCFVFVLNNYKKSWIAGYIKKEDFFSLATLKRKDEQEANGFIYRSDSWALEVKHLKQF